MGLGHYFIGVWLGIALASDVYIKRKTFYVTSPYADAKIQLKNNQMDYRYNK